LVRFEFESGKVLFYHSFTFVSWCAGDMCGIACSDEDRGRSRRPGAEDRGWSHRSDTRWPSGREVGWRHVRPASGTWRLGARVSWLSLKTKVNGFHWFGFKTSGGGFLQFDLKTGGDGFSRFDLKIGDGFLG
jgi:hypothetical protein